MSQIKVEVVTPTAVTVVYAVH